MPPDDWTDVLPPVDSAPHHARPAAAFPPHPGLARVASGWAWANIYATLAIWSALLVLLFWVAWNAR